MKKNEKESVEITLKEKYEALKKTNAGIRGQMGLQSKQITDLKKCVRELLDERDAKSRTITGLESQVLNLTKGLENMTSEYNYLDKQYNDCLARVDGYNQKPWYEKIFCFNI